MLVVIKSHKDYTIRCSDCGVLMTYDEYPPSGDWALISCEHCLKSPQDKAILEVARKAVRTINLMFTASSLYKAFKSSVPSTNNRR